MPFLDLEVILELQQSCKNSRILFVNHPPTPPPPTPPTPWQHLTLKHRVSFTTSQIQQLGSTQSEWISQGIWPQEGVALPYPQGKGIPGGRNSLC